MKKFVFCLTFALFLAICAGFAIAEGVTVDAETFAKLEEGFFEETFGGDVSSVTLSDTLTFSFVPEEREGLLPPLLLEMSEGMEVPKTTEAMTAVIRSILETAQYLQKEFPDAFLYNQALAKTYSDTGLGFSIAEPELWLWTPAKDGVLLPIYFHQQVEGAFADDVYLVSISRNVQGEGYYILYTNPVHIAEYMRQVPFDASKSQFQYSMILWLAERYVEAGGK